MRETGLVAGVIAEPIDMGGVVDTGIALCDSWSEAGSASLVATLIDDHKLSDTPFSCSIRLIYTESPGERCIHSVVAV